MFTVLVAGDDGEERVAGEGVLFGAEWGVESREGVSLLPSADRRPQMRRQQRVGIGSSVR